MRKVGAFRQKMAASIDPKMACRRQHIEELLDLLSRQFLEMVPIRKMKWKDEETAALVATPQLQQRVLQATVLHPVCRLHPPSQSYRTRFMKHLVQKLEQLDAEICDEVYETYTEMLTQREDEDDTLCFKTYTLPGGAQVSLQESVNLVSEGTTGLSTWQAAQHLAEWIVENPSILKDKRVLEVGCGLGLTGVVACRASAVRSYTFTDCHPQVLYLLARNVQTNLGAPSPSSLSSPSTSSSSSPSSSVRPQHPPSSPPDPRDKKMLRKIKRQLSLTTDNRSAAESASVVVAVPPTSCADVHSHSDLPSLDLHGDKAEKKSSEACAADKASGIGVAEEEGGWEEEEVGGGPGSDPSPDGGLAVSADHWDLEPMEGAATLRHDPRVSIRTLDWERAAAERLGHMTPDVVLGADVVYDPSVVPCLVAMLRRMLASTAGSKAFIASTVRNEDTRDAFLIALSAEGLSYEVMEGPKHSLFHYDRMVPIEILQISLQST